MKVLLISPASGHWKGVGRGRIFNGKTFRFDLLSLLSVAAETPPDVEVEIVDEQFEDISWHSAYDLVGITCMTAAAPRAYEISAEFRKRRIPVVLGGMHPTLCTDEVVRHADAIVVGDAEGVWPQVDGCPARYHARECPSLFHTLTFLQMPPGPLVLSPRFKLDKPTESSILILLTESSFSACCHWPVRLTAAQRATRLRCVPAFENHKWIWRSRWEKYSLI